MTGFVVIGWRGFVFGFNEKMKEFRIGRARDRAIDPLGRANLPRLLMASAPSRREKLPLRQTDESGAGGYWPITVVHVPKRKSW